MNFEAATVAVKTLTKTPSDKTLLTLYGLYKQATMGDNVTKQPWKFEIRKRAKWDAWYTHRGKSRVLAQTQYIQTVQRCIAAADSNK